MLSTQAYTASASLLRRVSERSRKTHRGGAVAWLVLGGMVCLCLLGSLLLALPAAVAEDAYLSWDYGDAAFTAISAVTCTGLTLKSTAAHFTFLGQLVILLLIQAGTLTILFAGVALARLVGQALAASAPGRALARPPGVPTVRFVLTATFVCELVGAALLYPMFAVRSDGSALPVVERAWYSLFHAVSAFCNAGFTLYTRGFLQGLSEDWSSPLREAWQVYGVIAPLIVLGGLGMSVL
ncbi:MAG: hypothetical protein NTV86_14590, partial [Planctomycetota bacterium]|nr:hypothetical protein [Planctomycetota bacterium]